MKKRASKKPATDVPVIAAYDPELGIDAQLRAAMRDSRKSRYAIAQESGISQSILSRFASGERGLTAETAERLAVALGLRLCLVSPVWSIFHQLADIHAQESIPQPPKELVRRALVGLTRVSPMKPYVSLLDLRAKLAEPAWLEKNYSPAPSRAEVDAAILELRRHDPELGRALITLSVAENRHPMTAAERDAFIVIDGEQYALISFR